MKNRVIVRYKVKPERVAENEQLVRDVYDELRRDRVEGLRYATFKLEDGVTFVHVASNETDDGASPLPRVAAFKRFQEGLRERCDELPVAQQAEEIGSFRFLD
jgi:hypothetical protein